MSPELADIVAKVPNCPALIFLLLKKSDRRPLIRVPSIALPRSSASLSLGDEVPHIFARKSRLKPGKFLITSAKRLLQQNRHDSDVSQCRAMCARRAAFVVTWGQGQVEARIVVAFADPVFSKAAGGADAAAPSMLPS